MLFIVAGNLVYTPVGPKHMLKCIDSLGMCTKNTTPDWKHFQAFYGNGPLSQPVNPPLLEPQNPPLIEDAEVHHFHMCRISVKVVIIVVIAVMIGFLISKL
jgi:hypothetical protein